MQFNSPTKDNNDPQVDITSPLSPHASLVIRVVNGVTVSPSISPDKTPSADNNDDDHKVTQLYITNMACAS